MRPRQPAKAAVPAARAAMLSCASALLALAACGGAQHPPVVCPGALEAPPPWVHEPGPEAPTGVFGLGVLELSDEPAESPLRHLSRAAEEATARARKVAAGRAAAYLRQLLAPHHPGTAAAERVTRRFGEEIVAGVPAARSASVRMAPPLCAVYALVVVDEETLVSALREGIQRPGVDEELFGLYEAESRKQALLEDLGAPMR